MSLSRRLFDLARAELLAALKSVKTTVDNAGLPEDPEPLESRPFESLSGAPRRSSDVPAEVCRYYANLELPVGASAAEVKAAYRRLMRRYHPDRHHGDGERSRVANELAQQLRTAYEGLLEHLGES